MNDRSAQRLAMLQEALVSGEPCIFVRLPSCVAFPK